MDFKNLKSFDWRSLKKYTSSQSSADLNKFLEKLPQNTNQTLLVIMGIAWACAAGFGLYTSLQMHTFTELRAELQENESVKPVVPKLKNIAVSKNEITRFVERNKQTYKGLNIAAKGSSIVLDAPNTAFFGQFREAVGHIQNGGSGWKIEIDRFCVGRECKGKQLSAVLKVNKISVENPQ